MTHEAIQGTFAKQAAPAHRLLKLVVQIPCYNEAQTLPVVLEGIPRQIDGIGCIEVQVIDDGSSDETVEIARRAGVEHIVRLKGNKGLARAFQAGIENALAQSADIIVNTDGDNQYCGSSIADLVRPIVEGRADIVLGDRKPSENRAFSWRKRMLQRIGSRVVRGLADLDVPDAVTGFRAYSRDAAMSINVMTRFSYTVETLIHAGQRGLTVCSVPVRTNPTMRPSRLFRSMGQFMGRQVVTMLRSCVMYRPLRTFMTVGLVMSAFGMLPILRFLYFYAIGDGDGHVQSLVLGGVLLLAGYFTLAIALLSDTIATNRRLTEEALIRLRRIEADRAPHATDADEDYAARVAAE
ncbi:glycosyltransferase family 2 protein [Salipiger mucosus]|uniref:Glycosyl transferase, family 2 n=1 Tax=Salipiger mucosus DSM 16094 TaxID=1123237 RepID=S9QGS3_9RHOB|nr:glycosyltransferase family 2 protein [Salipiger mucosus]EPX78818.1 Glycosyl transferase, family 2 [Salipiger mucosus DSM 16094]